ncbi:MAG: aryl-sulfate sulfotransferase [Ignavibacteria bacterium]|nr:aryl-sulfate sulfotransferase [Ignavibacteria bacterium]
MKYCLLIIFQIFPILVLSQNITYFYPIHNTQMHSISTPIIVRFDRPIDINDFSDKIKIQGSKSGAHAFEKKLSNDKKTLTIYTNEPFATEETVTVKILDKTFYFITSKITPDEQKHIFLTHFADKFPAYSNALSFYEGKKDYSDETASDTIPSDFPTIIIDSVRNPAPGYIYIANFGLGAERSYLMILDNNGKPIKYKKVPVPGFDFKMQPNGLITNARIIASYIPQGWGWAEAYMEVMDENLNIIDTVQCRGGYIADFHDFKMLPNGHYLLISYDPQPIDMSKIIPNGNPNAIVLGSIVQELDADKNVVFQWRDWDHIPITDTYSSLEGVALDPVHINAVELDYDGHILISSRHISEITKINRQTGEIIWRLGGKKNMFTFIGEHEENAPTYFSYQHDIRRQPDGNVTLYDNGVQHTPKYSRAVEYKLDEDNLTAELVWEYRNEPDIYGETMGSTQRLPNGNTVIGWGGIVSQFYRIVTEVNKKGEIEFELSFPRGAAFQMTTYRAYRFPYPPNLPEARVTKKEISQILYGTMPPLPKDRIHFEDTENQTGVTIVFDTIVDKQNSSITVEKYPFAPLYPRFTGETPLVNPYKIIIKTENIEQFEGKILFDLKKFPMIIHKHKKNISVWRRINKTTPFEPLPTFLADTSDLLGAYSNSLDGEYIFATDDFNYAPNKPTLVSPFNNFVLNTEQTIKFQWTPSGLSKFSRLLVSRDENFTDIVSNIDSIKNNIYYHPKLPEGRYYWKVKAFNQFEESEWSDVFSFEVKSPFIQIHSPKLNSILVKNTQYTFEWSHNLYPAFMITLYKGNTPITNVADSIYSVYGKLNWTVSELLENGNDYKIRITSLKNLSLFAESPRFEITDYNSVQFTNSKLNVLPNPFDEYLHINANDEKILKIEIYNLYGELLDTKTPEPYESNLIYLKTSHLQNGFYNLVVYFNEKTSSFPILKITRD